MPTVVVRPSNVYGPYDKFDFAVSHVTAALIRRVVERHSPLEVWGTGEDIRDLIYVDDFIEGMLAAFAADRPYLAINICAGTGHSVRQILEKILKVDGYDDADVRYDPSRPSTIPVRLMDNSLARAARLRGAHVPRGRPAPHARWYRASQRRLTDGPRKRL